MFDELNIKHISGKLKINLANNEAVVLCLVKDGEDYIDGFISYYLSIGFKHIFFMDNGSTDATLERAAKYKRKITILQSTADFYLHKHSMRAALFKAFGVGNWSLIADIDELFQFPRMDSLGLSDFLQYLNNNSYNSVVAQMIDLVPPKTLAQLKDDFIESIGQSEWFFDTNSIYKRPYDVADNILNNPDIMLWYGGVRSMIFGFDECFLTKHPLNFGSGKIDFRSSHTIMHRNVADVSAVLLHFKFIGDVYTRTNQAVALGNYYDNSLEYRAYLQAFESSKIDYVLNAGCIRYRDYFTLLQNELFVMSEQYRSFTI